MLKRIFQFLFLLTVFPTLSGMFLDKPLVKLNTTKREQLHKTVDAFVEAGLFNGVVLVAQDDSILLHKGYGFADYETKEQFSTDTKFRLGCISKQFTATAIMQLVERGLVDLHADITTYLPEFPVRGITIQHALTLSDGLPQFWDIPNADKNISATRKDMFAQICTSMKQKGVAFPPGSRFENTHTGYELLCLIIEKATGLSFEQYLKQNIFDRIGIQQTGCGFSCCSTQGLPSEYVLDGKALKKTAFKNPCLLPGAGSLYSTTRDLYTWIQALKRPGYLLGTKSFQQMITPHLRIPSKMSSACTTEGRYGYGLIVANMCKQPCIGHFGKISGFHSAMFHFPYRNSSIIVLSNLRSANVALMTKALADILFDSCTPSFKESQSKL